MEVIEFIKQAHDYALIYHKHLENATDANWRKVITAERKFLKWIMSNQVEAQVSDANSVHIDNIYNLIDACFTETYDDIRRHAPDNQILIANYLRATKIKLINAISCLSR